MRNYDYYSGDGGGIYRVAGNGRPGAEAAAPGETPRAVLITARGNVAGDTHPRQVHRNVTQRDGVTAQLSQ